MATKRIKHEIVCPYCDKTMGKQGIYGHIRGNHKGMEDDYRSRFPPKMTSLKPKKNEPKHAEIKEPEPDPIEEIMSEEIPEPEIKEEVKEPVKEVVKPVAPVIPAGDVKPAKSKSFLDWLFGEDDEDKSGVPKPDKDEDDDWL